MNQTQDTKSPLIDGDKAPSNSSNKNSGQNITNPNQIYINPQGGQQYVNPQITQPNQMSMNPNPYGPPQYNIPYQGNQGNQYRGPNQPYLMPQGQPYPQNLYLNQQPMQPGSNYPMNQQRMQPGSWQQPGQPGQLQMQGQPGKKFVPFNEAFEEGRKSNPDYQPNANMMIEPKMRSSKFNNDNLEGNRNETYEGCQTTCGEIKGWLGAYVCPCCCPNPYKLIPQGFSGLIMRFGKFKSLVGPGLHYVNVDVDTLRLVDKRERSVDLSNQVVVSRDNMSLRINAILFYKIVDTYKSQFKAGDVSFMMRDLAQTSLRSMIGQMTMQEFLEKREVLDKLIKDTMVKVCVNWGIELKRVLVQDVQLPTEFRNTMSNAAIEKRVAEAKVITAQADVEAARLMKEMSEMLNTEAALQIRYLETLNQIALTNNPKFVIFPTDYESIGFDPKTEEDETDRLIN